MPAARKKRGWWLAASALVALAAFSALAYAASDEYARARAAMVQGLRKRGIRNERVLEAMGQVPRHLFVPRESRFRAYSDDEIAIGSGEAMLRPHTVALMLQALDPPAKGKVLEISTSSGYEAAVLAELCQRVFTVESRRKVGEAARERLRALGCASVQLRTADSLKGWPDKGPFDAILVKFPVDRLPQALLDQLAEGGRLVFLLGVGQAEQTLNRVQKVDGRLRSEIIATTQIRPPSPPEEGKPG